MSKGVDQPVGFHIWSVSFFLMYRKGRFSHGMTYFMYEPLAQKIKFFKRLWAGILTGLVVQSWAGPLCDNKHKSCEQSSVLSLVVLHITQIVGF